VVLHKCPDTARQLFRKRRRSARLHIDTRGHILQYAGQAPLRLVNDIVKTVESFTVVTQHPMVSPDAVTHPNFRQVPQVVLEIEDTEVMTLEPCFISTDLFEHLPAAKFIQRQVKLHVHMPIAIFPFGWNQHGQLHRQLIQLIKAGESPGIGSWHFTGSLEGRGKF